MPIVQIYMPADHASDEAVQTMLVEASQFYVETLYPDTTPPPIERVRAFVNEIDPKRWVNGGKAVSDGGDFAPFFTCLVLAGRPVEQHHALITGFTEIIARHLPCQESAVRGQVIPIDADNWGIGGVPASQVRAKEIAQRAQS